MSRGLGDVYKRQEYEKYWDDISPFIKFGCLKDSKFSDRMMDYILVKNLDGKYLSLDDFIKENQPKEEEAAAETAEANDAAEAAQENTTEEASDEETEKEPPKTTLYYVTDEVQQSQYINMFKEAGMDAAILKHNIDTPFITHVEQKKENVHFQRIDADVTDSVKEETSEDELKETTETLTDVFRKALGKDKLEVKVEKLKNEKVSSMITLSEETRRMQEMMKMYNMYGMDPDMFGGSETLVLNANNALVQFILNNKDSEHVPMMCEQLYDLAMLSHAPLSPEAMTKFIARSNEIMMLLTK